MIKRIIWLVEDPKKYDYVTVDRDGFVCGWVTTYSPYVGNSGIWWNNKGYISAMIGECEYEGNWRELIWRMK